MKNCIKPVLIGFGTAVLLNVFIALVIKSPTPIHSSQETLAEKENRLFPTTYIPYFQKFEIDGDTVVEYETPSGLICAAHFGNIQGMYCHPKKIKIVQ